MECTCDVGPGRFEGEPAETFFLWEWSLDGAGESHGPEGASYDYFEGGAGPADFTDALLIAARREGFCIGCIAEAILRLGKAHGAVVGQDSQGFVWSKVADTEAEHAKMIADMAADDADAEEQEQD